jgi:hypothetical protein
MIEKEQQSCIADELVRMISIARDWADSSGYGAKVSDVPPLTTTPGKLTAPALDILLPHNLPRGTEEIEIGVPMSIYLTIGDYRSGFLMARSELELPNVDWFEPAVLECLQGGLAATATAFNRGHTVSSVEIPLANGKLTATCNTVVPYGTETEDVESALDQHHDDSNQLFRQIIVEYFTPPPAPKASATPEISSRGNLRLVK